MYHANPKIIGDIIEYGGKLNAVDNDEVSVIEHISKNMDSFYHNIKDEQDYIKWKKGIMKGIEDIYRIELKYQ